MNFAEECDFSTLDEDLRKKVEFWCLIVWWHCQCFTTAN